MHSAFLWKLLALLLIVLLAVGSTHGAKSRYDKRIEDKDDDDEDGDTETEDDDYIQPPAPSHRVKGQYNKTRIVNGRPAEPGEFPYIVRIWLDTSLTGCSGSIFDYNHIITAAHCLIDKKTGKLYRPGQILLYVGDYKVDEQDGETLVSVYKTAIHPNYSTANGQITNDIGVIETVERITFSQGDNGYGKVMPLFPINPGEMFTFENKVTAAGWGNVDDGIKTNVIWTYDTFVEPCQDWRVPQNPQYMCTPKGKTACHGDSGGPLIYKGHKGHIHIGVASFIPGGICGEAQTYYMSLDHFIEDIRKMISQLDDNARASSSGRGCA